MRGPAGADTAPATTGACEASHDGAGVDSAPRRSCSRASTNGAEAMTNEQWAAQLARGPVARHLVRAIMELEALAERKGLTHADIGRVGDAIAAAGLEWAG